MLVRDLCGETTTKETTLLSRRRVSRENTRIDTCLIWNPLWRILLVAHVGTGGYFVNYV